VEGETIVILITGTSAGVGRALVNNLLNQKNRPRFRAVVRNQDYVAPDSLVEYVQGHPSQPETLVSALRGVTALFINPSAVGQAVTALVDLAREQGVRRVVTLSASVEDDYDGKPLRDIGAWNRQAEEAVVAGGLESVILQADFLATTTRAMWRDQLLAGDVVRGSFAEWRTAPVHEINVAAVVARALLTDGLLGQRIVLTGPNSLTQHEMVAAIGAATGRSLRFRELPPKATREDMTARGFDAGLVDAFLAAQAEKVDRPPVITGEVERILGHPAHTYARWAVHHREDLRNPGTP
jgi:uncharacterized protein YbjT (DUF2867 family)